jgi:hypothetical protein
MASRKTCDKCAHYTPGGKGSENDGSCAKAGDANDGPVPTDGIVGWDYESFAAGVYVGPKFGCIHWVKKA